VKEDKEDGELFDFLDDNLKKDEESPKVVEATGIIADKNTTEDKVRVFPKMVGKDCPNEYQNVVDRFLTLYAKLPDIDYDQLHEEIAELNVKSKPTSTLQLINVRLQEIQGAKDRLSEISQKVIRCHTIKKRAVNILSDAWNKFADGSSADKRKSDSAFRLSDFHADLSEVEALNNACGSHSTP